MIYGWRRRRAAKKARTIDVRPEQAFRRGFAAGVREATDLIAPHWPAAALALHQFSDGPVVKWRFPRGRFPTTREEPPLGEDHQWIPESVRARELDDLSTDRPHLAALLDSEQVTLYDYFMADILKQLRKAMMSSRLSRYQISLLTGLDQGALSRFANEQSALSVESTVKLAKALDLKLRLVPAEQKTRTTTKTAPKRGGA
ncbi:MAG: helix-turn-helix transcriptional regulator [Phycisphaerales bacterium]|nr:helix-turn-helix transcriptional regulator [Phycisphaerales bacterium]